MAFSVEMPALGESVTEGTVTRWLKQEGDSVETDEPLLEVSTDKVDTEIPSPTSGVLKKIVAQEDDVVEVGGKLAEIGDADDDDGDSGSDSSDEKSEDDSKGEEQESGSDESESTDESEPEPESDDESESEPEEEAPAASSDDSGDDDSGESSSVTMPELGESVSEGTITRWLKSVGDKVEADEPLLEVSTDKVDTEIPSPVAGTLLEIKAEEDDVVEVGGQLAVIGSGSPSKKSAGKAEESESDEEPEDKKSEPEDEDDDAKDEESEPESKKEPEPEPEPEKDEKDEKPEPKQEKKESSDKEGSGTGDGRAKGATPYVTPLVRKLAEEHNVDLSSLTGSGVGGRIRKQDVLAAAEESKEPEPAAEPEKAPAASASQSTSADSGVRPELAKLRGTTQKANRIRQITAKKTRESLQTTAQLTQTHEVDVSKIAALRARAKASFKEREGVNLTYLPFFAKAVVEALGAHPNVNASYDEEAKEITYHGSVHLGIAVDTEQGLLSPVIHNASDLSLAGLARAIADLAERTRARDIKPEELAGGTFTITNIGSNGALFDTPILVPPQAAMLGTGAIVKRPVVVTDSVGNELIGVRSMCYLPLTYDHRLIDGADAGRFLTTIKQRLEEAAFDADLGL